MDFDGDRLIFSVGSATNGKVSISGNTISYTPNSSSIKSDAFEITASDGNGGFAKQKIEVVIGSPATPSNSLLSRSGIDNIDMMLNGYKWYGSTIYYSFSVGPDGESVPSDPAQFEKDLQFIFETAFGTYLDINFVFLGFFESPEYAYYSGSNINVSLDRTNFSSPNILGRANFPVPNTPLSSFPSNYKGSEGDVFININGPANYLTYAPGSEGFLLLLHEIGHALGLKHPHDDGGSGRPTFADLKLNGLNIDWWTIMSYNDDSSSLYYWDPTTPMVLDVIALQYLYGSSRNASGDNIYDLRFDIPAYFTIFDSAGSDVLDFRKASEGVYIELPSLWINNFQEYPIGIAAPLSDFYRSAPTYLTWLYGVFEELQGSSYSDFIVGSQNADKIFANAGNDAIRGGPGSDTIDGGSGTDTAFFADPFAECSVTFDGDQCIVTTKTEGVDRLTNIEKLVFGPNGSSVEYTVANLKNRSPVFASSSQSTSTNEDAAKAINVNATDADGDQLTYTISKMPTNGTATISGSTVTYTPKANYNGGDSFIVTASDGKGGTATQTFNITVTAVNDAPAFSASSQTVSATAGTAKTITLAATDVDGDALTYTATTPSKGSATISGSTLTYTPTSSASGTDTFVVTARDPSGATASQTINVTVAAVSNTDFRLTASDGWTGAVGGNGLVYGTSGYQDIKVLSGTVTFDASFNKGGDIVRFDGGAGSYTISRTGSSAQISAGTNLSAVIPIGTAGLATTFADGVRKLAYTNNNFTLGGQVFSTSAASITAAADGSSLPTGASSSASARITLTGNDLSAGRTSHITVGGTAVIYGNSAKSDIVAVATGVAANLTFDASFNRGGDTIILDKSAGSYSAIRSGASVVLTSAGQTLTIPVGTAGISIKFADDTRTLVYSTTEAAIKLGTQTIATTATAITPLNRAPAFAAASQAVSTNEDTAKTITLSATDADGDSLTYTVSTAAGKGTATVSGNSVIYTPNADYNGTDSFVVTASDGKGGTATQTVTVTVIRVNDAPSFRQGGLVTGARIGGVGYSFPEDQSQTIVTTRDAVDPDGDPLVFTVSTPSSGRVTVNGGLVVYTPNANFNGTDSFNLTVSDGKGGSSTIPISITVTPVNDAPTFSASSQAIAASAGVAKTVALSATDVDGDTLTYTVSTAPTNGTATISGNTLTYTPTANYNGSDSLVVTVSDGKGGIATQTISATVTAAITLSLDVGTASTTATVSGANGSVTFTDDASKNSFVKITNFTSDDVIRVIGATEDKYSFSSGDFDGDGSADDLSISFSDSASGVVNDIQIINAVNPTAFVFDRASAVAAVGFNFISFG